MREKFILEVIDAKTSAMLEIVEKIEEEQKNLSYEKSLNALPEWVNLEMAHKLKGGGALGTFKKMQCLQPCCGTNSKIVCGRKSWNKRDVIEWLSITDHDLKNYAERFGVTIPKTFEKRSK